MPQKFTESHASRIISALDDRAARKNKDGAQVQTTWGTIGAVDAGNKFASAYLYGETNGAYMSTGFRIPEATYLTVGEVVKVAINYSTGERWITEVKTPATAYKKVAIDINAGTVLTGDGTAPPTPAASPTGSMVLWPTAAAPAGWLIANGAAVNRTTYASLFAVIGTVYGTGDGSTTFNLPNLKSRFPVGFDSANARWDVLGETGGAETHTHATHATHSAHAFTQPAGHSAHAFTQPATHTAHTDHAFTQPSSHSLLVGNLPTGHYFPTSFTSTRTAAAGADGAFVVASTQGSGTAVTHTGGAVDAHTAHSAHSGGAVDAHSAHSGGAVDAHSAHDAHDAPASIPPYIALNFIIKA